MMLATQRSRTGDLWPAGVGEVTVIGVRLRGTRRLGLSRLVIKVR